LAVCLATCATDAFPFFEGGSYMQITSVEVGCVTAAGREKRVVTVRVKLGQPQESLRITVVVPEASDIPSARECGIARAKDFARQFASLDS
jgi:hypothetical protein